MKEKIEALLDADKIEQWLTARGEKSFPTGHRFEDFLAQYLRDGLKRPVSIDQGGMMTIYDDDEIPVYADSLPARWWEWVQLTDGGPRQWLIDSRTGNEILALRPFTA